MTGDHRVSRRSVLGGVVAGGGYALASAAFGRVSAAHAAGARPSPADPATLLWFDEPATDWQDQAFPIGNGHSGAMIFGGVITEQVQLNQESLWIGGPGSIDDGHAYNFGNWYEKRPDALSGVRQTIASTGSADVTEAMVALGQTKWGYGAYQTFGDLFMDFATEPATVTNYRRDLDLATGVASVEFTGDGVGYRREYFASYPDGVLVAMLSADQPGSVAFTARLSTPDNRSVTATATGHRITIRGALTDNGMIYEGQFQVAAHGGSVTDNADGTVTVAGADSATIVAALGTNYAQRYPDYRGNDPHTTVTATVNRASRLPYERLRAAQLADHGELFGRVRIDLGQQTPSKPTDELLADFKAARNAADVPADPELELLHFHIGRYLLIASSRAGCLPANLQGVWNDSVNPDWQSDYTTNINLEMNYWPAELTNLTETVPPLVDFIDRLRPAGRVTARDLCQAGGWAAMNHVNAFGYSGVSTNASTWSPESTGWLVRALWEHYLFTLDEKFLAERAYPILKEHVQFWLDYLVVDHDGTLVVSPSFSPEHGPFTAGASYSQMIVWDLFTNTIKAGEILGIDQEFRSTVATTLARLDPGLRIGGWGQLQEWKTDMDDPEDGHRHMSHLYALFPSSQITAENTPDYFAAARVSVDARTAHTAQNDIGWNRAQKVNFFARLGNGNQAREQMDHLLWRNTFANFLNDWPFQIDGNFGVCSGMAEMLLQSHTGTIDVLPALPDGWPAGSFDGLRARGAVTVGADWAGGMPTQIRLRSDHGGRIRLRSAMPAARVAGTGYRMEGNVVEFTARAGVTYRVTPR